VRWKAFASFCSKFIQETVYQISSASPEFYRRYYKQLDQLSQPKPRCSVYKLSQKYKCEKLASNIALSYGVDVDK